ncbi:MAG: hypothetical protein IIB15_01160 [Chloroflexi bacterium]|nr:hypothetical protein [Chloroflexota bacterium]
MVIPAAMMLLLLSVPIVSAGGRWSGINPILAVNGDRINIWLGWPTGKECMVDYAGVFVHVAHGVDVQFISESSEVFICENGYTPTIRTETVYDKGLGNVVRVEAIAYSSEYFETNTEVYLNGKIKSRCRKFTSELMSFAPVSLSGSGSTGDDGNVKGGGKGKTKTRAD